MIIIDEHTDTHLLMALEAYKRAPEMATRCISITNLEATVTPQVKAQIVAAAQCIPQSENTQLYFAEDGEIVLIATPLTTRNGNQFMLAMADLFEWPADKSWIGLYDLALHCGSLLMRIEARQEKRREMEALQQQQLEHQRAARKRQSILSHTIASDVSTIDARRTSRTEVELMIIEDDVFSSRLVENVLQKKYAMTSLKEADRALDTYVRLAPDLIFLDINLPDVTGHELLERMLAIDPNAHVIMLSGNADQKNITQAMGKGAKGFIAKPFTREKLFQYIDRCPTIASKQCVQPIS